MHSLLTTPACKAVTSVHSETKGKLLGIFLEQVGKHPLAEYPRASSSLSCTASR